MVQNPGLIKDPLPKPMIIFNENLNSFGISIVQTIEYWRNSSGSKDSKSIYNQKDNLNGRDKFDILIGSLSLPISKKLNKSFKKLQKLQKDKIAFQEKGKEFPSRSEKSYQTSKAVVVELIKGLQINTNKIEELINKLYVINKGIVSLEGKLLRLALQYKISRDEFLDKYIGNENNPYWLRKITRLAGWEKFVKNEKNNKSERSIRTQHYSDQ